jgi:hypothetical protein
MKKDTKSIHLEFTVEKTVYVERESMRMNQSVEKKNAPNFLLYPKILLRKLR